MNFVQQLHPVAMPHSKDISKTVYETCRFSFDSFESFCILHYMLRTRQTHTHTRTQALGQSDSETEHIHLKFRLALDEINFRIKMHMCWSVHAIRRASMPRRYHNDVRFFCS